MLIEIDDRTNGKVIYEVCLNGINSVNYMPSIIFSTLLNGKLKSRDRGYSFDKFSSSFTIEDFQSDLFEFSKRLNVNLRQLTVTCNEAELVFGPGVDYTNPIVCSSPSRIPFPQMNYGIATLDLNLSALSSNNLQLQFKSAVPSTMPSNLIYQAPLERFIEKDVGAFESSKFGTYGSDDVVDSSNDPVKFDEVEITLKQNEADTAAIQKFVSLQRATPFVWPDTNAPKMFENQLTKPVIITNYSLSWQQHNLWETALTIRSNV